MSSRDLGFASPPWQMCTRSGAGLHSDLSLVLHPHWLLWRLSKMERASWHSLLQTFGCMPSTKRARVLSPAYRIMTPLQCSPELHSSLTSHSSTEDTVHTTTLTELPPFPNSQCAVLAQHVATHYSSCLDHTSPWSQTAEPLPLLWHITPEGWYLSSCPPFPLTH